MELIRRPGKPKYRIIVRDEETDKSKSIGVYKIDGGVFSEMDLDEIVRVLKEKLEQYLKENEPLR